MPQGRYLFVSDLHLEPAAPGTIASFLGFLAREARNCQGLYILGDLFDTWIGDDDDEPARMRICEALRELTRQGTPCRLLHGNRDFLLGACFAAHTGCELLPDPTPIEVGGRRFVLSHGDQLCTADVGYQRFRRLSRSRAVQRTWLMLPLSVRRRIAGLARRRSYAHTRRLAPEIMDVTPQAVTDLLRTTGAEILIHGHTHRPGAHPLQVDGRPCTRIVLGDWYDQGSALALHADGSWETVSLAQP